MTEFRAQRVGFIAPTLDPGIAAELARVYGPPVETDGFPLTGTSAPFAVLAGRTLALRATLRDGSGDPGEVSAIDEATGATLFTTTGGGVATWRSAGQTFRLHSTADVDIDARVFLP